MGLNPGAPLEEVHRAYKRLVLKYHPDRSHGGARSHRIFCRLTEAYARLQAAFAAHEAPHPLPFCQRCGDAGRLFRATDGRLCCADCLLARRRKRLPMPRPQTVRCLATIGLDLAAMFCLVFAVKDASLFSAVLGLFSLLAALMTLSYDVLTSVVVAR